MAQHQRQAPAPSSGAVLGKLHLAAVHIYGSKRYSEAQILSVLGFKAGSEATAEELQAGSNRLGASGAFATVQFEYGWGPNGYGVTYHVTDNPQYVPVVFQNFVWFKRDELRNELRARVPLFNGEIPLTGDLREQVRSSLERMMTAKGVHESAGFIPRMNASHELLGMSYYADPPVRISAASLRGSALSSAEPVQKLLAKLSDAPFEETYVYDFCERSLKPVFLAKGLLAVKFADPDYTATKQDDATTTVALSIPVTDGTQYRYRSHRWDGNSLYPAEQLSKFIQLKPGAIANYSELLRNLAKVHDLYGTRGYEGQTVEIEPLLNDQTGEADFVLHVTEGTQYTMRHFAVTGAPPELMPNLTSKWKLPEGSIYDASYKLTYMAGVMQTLSRGNWQYQVREVLDDQQHWVDVYLDVRKQGAPMVVSPPE